MAVGWEGRIRIRVASSVATIPKTKCIRQGADTYPFLAMEPATVSDKRDKLLARMNHVRERFSILGPKPQNLPYDDIVARVADFMLSQDEMRIAYAFGNEVGEDLEDENDARFDPIALYQAHPDRIDKIVMYVEAEMQSSEKDLLQGKDRSLFAYNTLVFGSALRLADSKAVSPELLDFLIEHLIEPKPPSESKRRGRPKNTNDELRLKRQAIEFAVAHGLTATRNDVTFNKPSACDAVADAGRKLYQTHGDEKFISGYTFEALKKIWRKSA
ncbi:MAG: hypothetical protein ACI89J_001507 [Hyphomicrobiaceae bacterium]|jgi:hypothetical protein